MIAVVVLIVLGVMEVVTIGRLHEYLGTNNLVLFYLATTSFCALIALIFFSSYKLEKNKYNLSNKFNKRLKEGNLTDKDHRTMASVMYCAAYIIGCVLIAIPGIITDFLGLLLVIPLVNKYFTSRFFTTSLEQYYKRKNNEL